MNNFRQQPDGEDSSTTENGEAAAEKTPENAGASVSSDVEPVDDSSPDEGAKATAKPGMTASSDRYPVIPPKDEASASAVMGSTALGNTEDATTETLPADDEPPSLAESPSETGGVEAAAEEATADSAEATEPPPIGTEPADPIAETAVEEIDPEDPEEIWQRLAEGRDRLMAELRKVIVGQEKVVEELILVLFSGGHCLLSGAPGLAKTLLIRTLARIMDLNFKRIQFTPDLMPADITGTEIIDEDSGTGHRELRFIHGPIFTNVLLADEINRTPPKTQSALLEAMEEKQVTVAGETHDLSPPFYVFATQNPIELEGTYPLPEAQLDRFMFKVLVNYLDEDQELAVATRTTSGTKSEVDPVFSAEDMLRFARLVRSVPIAEPVARYAVRLAQATRPGFDGAPDFVQRYVGWGAGTRASQYLILAAKARALLASRFHVACEDIRAVAHPVLRHRILTNFQADADRIDVESIIDQLLKAVAEPSSNLSD